MRNFSIYAPLIRAAVAVQRSVWRKVLDPDAQPVVPENFFPYLYITETVEEYETHWHASTVLKLAEIATRSGDKS